MVEIKKIEPTRSNLKRFTRFQNNLYKGNPYYIPVLVEDDVNTLDPNKNPAFEHCDAAYFMAYIDGKPVGRIAGIINKQVNEKSGNLDLRFGFDDFIDDQEVSSALFEAVEKWGREKGMTRVIGTMGFTDLDHEGMLVDGFEELGTMATIYNHSYYPAHLDRLGYVKEVDWVEFVMDVPDAIPDKYNRIADIVKQKFGLKVKKFTSKKQLKSNTVMPCLNLLMRHMQICSDIPPLQINK